jgi:predicted alpha/beta superfamily hydrolase
MSDTPSLVTLPDSEVHLLESSHVDQTYKLFISLPEGYADSKDSYPVLYVTDANWVFSIFYSASWFLPIPPMIVVGIGYPTDDFADIFRLRARDFLPTKSIEEEKRTKEISNFAIESGGSGDFISFIREELFPFINSRYRTKIDDRTLYGYSYGGTFGIYTLFNHSDTFIRYIIGAPVLLWDNRVCFAYEREYAERSTDLATKLYLSVGALDEDLTEHNASQLLEFHAILKNRNYPSLNMDFEVFNGETHGTGGIPTMSWGLRSVFG